MKKRSYLNIVLLLVFILSSFMPVAAQKKSSKRELKKRIAVFDFGDKTDHRYHWWRHDQNVGQGMADMLVTALVKSGKYIVIERQEIEKIIKEQQLGLSGLVTEQSAAKVGKLLGVEIAVIGNVTEFGWAKSKKSGRFKGIGAGVSTSKAVVGMDIRLINTSTGEILAAENVRKEEKKRGISFRNSKIAYKNRNDFDESLVGKATRKAVENIVKLVNKQIAAVPWSGKIILQKGDVVYVNAGSEAGVMVGDQFVVYRPGEELIDPDTGLNLGSEEERIGKIEIVSDMGQGKASKAKILEGTSFQKGDIIREK